MEIVVLLPFFIDIPCSFLCGKNDLWHNIIHHTKRLTVPLIVEYYNMTARIFGAKL